MKENILIVSACVRKKDLLEVGGFGITEKKVYEDWYLWLKLIKAGKYPIRMNSLLTYYRQKKEFSELNDSNIYNRENAMNLIREVKRDIIDYKNGMQFPKFDYNWEKIKEQYLFENRKISKSSGLKFEFSLDKENLNIKKNNILMIIPWMVTGGADRFNLDLVSRMDNKNFNFIIITTLPAKNEWRKYFSKYATIYDLTTFLDMKDWIGFINYIIQKNDINLIFNSNSQFGYKILPYLKAKYPKIPIVDYVHMEEWYLRNGGFSRDSSTNRKVIDKTFTCNENSRRVFIKNFKRNENEIKTLYVGVDEKKYNPENYDKEKILKEIENKINKEKNLKNTHSRINGEKFLKMVENKINVGKSAENAHILSNKKIVSYICRITEQKRPYLFFEVIKKLIQTRNLGDENFINIDFVVLVVGDGPMLEGLKDKVKNARLDKYFIFLGNLKNTEKIYKISDVTVNTSLKEGIALTSYESLAMDVPVVSANVGGQSELITEDVGIIVPCLQDEKDILNFNYSDEEINNYVQAISKILDRPRIYKNSCRKRIIEKFTIDNMIKQIEQEFIEIINNPNDEKIQNGIDLSKNIDILKELISTYLIASKPEYEYLVEVFNQKNVHKRKYKNRKKGLYYEQTIEYKIKHPVVVALRKIGIYEDLKKVLYRE